MVAAQLCGGHNLAIPAAVKLHSHFLESECDPTFLVRWQRFIASCDLDNCTGEGNCGFWDLFFHASLHVGSKKLPEVALTFFGVC